MCLQLLGIDAHAHSDIGLMPKLINAVICTSIFICCSTENTFAGFVGLEKERKGKEGDRREGEIQPGC